MNTNFSDINLKDLIEYMGEEVIPHGRQRYKMKKHDSLILKDSVFIWNSKMIKGNYYTLLNSLYGMNGREIYLKVNNFLNDIGKGKYIPSENIKYSPREKIEKYIFDRKEDYKKIEKYLSDKRKIDQKIIKSLYKSNLICIDERNNINFIIKDIKNGNILGAEVVGTGQKKFKKNTSISNGFNIENPPLLKKEIIYIFESPIDLISYLEMNKEKNLEEKHKEKGSIFLSISGLREDILENYIDKNIKKIYICTDNDVAGNNFYDLIKEKYNDIKIYRKLPIKKDWNEDLMSKKENNLEHIKKNIKEKELER